MDRLAYLAAMALLGIGLTMAQNAKPNSDPGNSSNSSMQSQSSASGTADTGQIPATTARHHRTATGSATATPDSVQQANKSPAIPQNSAAPHAALTQGPAARAAATHTPDPGTCMNPDALQTTENGVQTNTGSPCR